MTRTFNRETYANLLSQYQPKVIATEEENEAAISLAEALEHRERTLEEDALLELLVTLIEKFEEEYYPLLEGDPHLEGCFRLLRKRNSRSWLRLEQWHQPVVIILQPTAVAYLESFWKLAQQVLV